MTDFKPCPFCGKQRISLITRLENLKGSSREVDADIAKTIGWRYELSSFSGLSFWINPAGKREELPNFTGSIDAAMTLVPEGLVIKSTLCADRDLQIVEAWLCCEADDVIVIDDSGPYTKHRPAIALCIAALKAREADNAD